MDDTALPLFLPENRSVLFETLRQLDYDQICKICGINREINEYCQDNLQIKLLLISKRTDKLIVEHGNEYNTLIYASQKGDLDIVNELLERGVDPNANIPNNLSDPLIVHRNMYQTCEHPDYNGDHALIEASRNGRLNIVNFMLERGVDPSIYNNLAIILASLNGHLDIINRLCEDQRVDSSDLQNIAVIFASSKSDVDPIYNTIIMRLLDDPLVNPFTDDTFMGNMSCPDDINLMKRLLSDPRFDPSYDNNDCIRGATMHSTLEIIDLLLADPRVDPTYNNGWGIETLMNAAGRENKALIQRLLDIPAVRNNTPYLNDYVNYVNGTIERLPQHCYYYC